MANPRISVITPASRGVKTLTYLINDFKNQTFKDFEHIIVWDGTVPDDVRIFMKKHEKDYNLRFTRVDKDRGNMGIAPGTKPRNHGVTLSRGTYVVFCDDDDRYRDTYLETLISHTRENTIAVVQMSCQESRMFKNGSPENIVLVPEIDLPRFPVICHVGTPCFLVKREWAVAEPWRSEPEHDFRFIKRICDKFHPTIQIVGGMQVDVDGLVIKNLKDWVSIPPFYRS
jgi:glycosyltransferase involved in cell wall biosynthesis